MSSWSAAALSRASLQWLAIDASLFQDCMKSFPGVLLSRYRFKKSLNFMPRASRFLAWADVSAGFPRTLMRVIALMAFFLCNCGDRKRLDRHLTSEGYNTLFMVKTSGKAQCAPYYKNTITYSISL